MGEVMLRAFTYTMITLLLLPMALVIATSFTQTSYVTFLPQGFTVKWYVEAWNKSEYFESFRLSLLVAALTALWATAMGLPVAVVLRRTDGWLRALLEGLFMSPLILPTIIIGIAMLQYFNRLGIGTTFWGLTAGHVVITAPYVIRLVGASLAAIDPRIEFAARNLGAPPLTAFVRTTGRLALPGLIAGFLFSFVISFDNVTISVFLSTPKLITLPVRIYNLLDQPISPWLVAICSMVIGVTTVLIVLIERTTGLARVVGH
jgi:putative spermidine/putrescine transport system permease protein